MTATSALLFIESGWNKLESVTGIKTTAHFDRDISSTFHLALVIWGKRIIFTMTFDEHSTIFKSIPETGILEVVSISWVELGKYFDRFKGQGSKFPNFSFHDITSQRVNIITLSSKVVNICDVYIKRRWIYLNGKRSKLMDVDILN